MQQAPLPSQFIDTNPIPQPIAILDHRMIRQQGNCAKQLLVQWENRPESDATWELATIIQQEYPSFYLEAKDTFDGRSNDASKAQHSPSMKLRKTTRQIKRPTKL